MTDQKTEQDLKNIKVPGTWGPPVKRVPVPTTPDDVDPAEVAEMERKRKAARKPVQNVIDKGKL